MPANSDLLWSDAHSINGIKLTLVMRQLKIDLKDY